MKVGVCTGIENAEVLAEYGYDYIEMVLNWVAGLSDNEFEELKNKIEESPLKVEAVNCFVPGDIKLVGDEVDKEKIKEYLQRSIYRASVIGAEIIVFGSGKARNVPEGFPREKAWQQIKDFLYTAAGIVKEYGITIAIEPLRRQESNIINTAEEGFKLAKEVDEPNIRLLVDYKHMMEEDENPDIIQSIGTEYLKHVHISSRYGFTWPKTTDKDNYQPFFNNLKKIGYTGRISIEARTEDVEKDARLSMEFFKTILK